MIGAKSIREMAKVSGLRPWQQEKHYLQSVLLSSLSDLPLVFKGGTYLWFFHGLNRFSEDLNFTITGNIKKDLPEFVSKSLNLYGFSNKLKNIKNEETGISARFMINGPLNTSQGDSCVIYVEASGRETILLPKIPLKLDFPQYDLPIKNLLGMNLDEVGAEKVRAILTRKKARDIFDLYYLIGRKNIKFDVDLINQKISVNRLIFNKSLFLTNLKEREESFAREMKQIVLGELPPFEEVFKRISIWVNFR